MTLLALFLRPIVCLRSVLHVLLHNLSFSLIGLFSLWRGVWARVALLAPHNILVLMGYEALKIYSAETP
jgi:hypothetical protein